MPDADVVCPVSAATSTFQVWNMIDIGTYGSAKDLLRALTDGGFRVSTSAAEILQRTSLVESKAKIQLVIVTARELGFTQTTSCSNIYTRASELGLYLVPAEVGPQLRLQYPHQKKGQWLLMASEPIVNSFAEPRIFDVANVEGLLMLTDNDGRPDGIWNPDYLWVFRYKPS